MWVQPGHADDSVTIHTGYGRRHGRVADVQTNSSQLLDKTATSGGTNIYPARATTGMMFAAEISLTSDIYESHVQDHSLEGRDMYRQATLKKYKEKPDYASFKSIHKYAVQNERSC